MPAGNYKPLQVGGTTNASAVDPKTVQLTKNCFRMCIQNTDTTNPMDISFDGTNWFTLFPKLPYTFDVFCQKFYVRSAFAVIWAAVISSG